MIEYGSSKSFSSKTGNNNSNIFTNARPQWFHIGSSSNAPAKLALQVQLSDEISSLDNFNEWYKNGQNNTFERKALDVVKPIYKVLWNDDSATYDNDNKLLQDIKLCSADKNIEGKESKPPN